jgi:hypothetical protein
MVETLYPQRPGWFQNVVCVVIRMPPRKARSQNTNSHFLIKTGHAR